MRNTCSWGSSLGEWGRECVRLMSPVPWAAAPPHCLSPFCCLKIPAETVLSNCWLMIFVLMNSVCLLEFICDSTVNTRGPCLVIFSQRLGWLVACWGLPPALPANTEQLDCSWTAAGSSGCRTCTGSERQHRPPVVRQPLASPFSLLQNKIEAARMSWL